MNILQLLADSFLKILIPGIKVTIPLTVISFTLSLLIGMLSELSMKYFGTDIMKK